MYTKRYKPVVSGFENVRHQAMKGILNNQKVHFLIMRIICVMVKIMLNPTLMLLNH